MKGYILVYILTFKENRVKKEKFDCSKFILDCFVWRDMIVLHCYIYKTTYLYGFFIRNGLTLLVMMVFIS